MVDYGLLAFAFTNGVFSFFAPCAVALLPGYLATFVTKNVAEDKQTKKVLVKRAILLSIFACLGIAVIYGISGLAIFLVSSWFKQNIGIISLGIGVVIAIMGIIMLMGKNLSLPIHGKRMQAKNQSVESFLFGLMYGVTAVGCLFPLFLALLAIAITKPVLEASIYLGAYIIGMSLFMVTFFITAVLCKEFIQKKLHKVLPYITRVGGALLVLAGIYTVYYHWALVF